MAVKWTPQRDQNLLLLIIKDVKPNYQDLADKWSTQFHEEYHPTAKALSEHVAALKRKMGGSSGAAGTTNFTPSSKPKTTNGTPKTPKTPASKGKRSCADMMSNKDDSEGEQGMDSTPARKRITPSRHAVPRRYKEEFSESDGEDVIFMSVAKAAGANGTVHSPGDAGVEGPRPSIARSKSNPPKLSHFRDSDGESEGEGGSDFELLA